VLSDFASISGTSLLLTIEYHHGQLLQEFMQQLLSSKVELQRAVMIALAKIFDQRDKQFLQNESREEDSVLSHSTVFSLPC
jgi:hypothetical protein